MARKPEDRTNTSNKRRATILKKQLAELDRRFKENDFEKPQRPGPPDYTEEVRQQQLQVDTAKRRLDEMVEKAENRKRPMVKRVLEVAHAGHLFNIFTSLMVYPKLMAAVLGGHGLAVGQAGTISVLKSIPAIRRLADISARQGAGLTIAGLKARFGKGLSEAPRAAKDTLVHGRSALEAAYGDTDRMSDAFLGHMGTLAEAMAEKPGKDRALAVGNVLASYAGRTHGAIKVFLAHPEFYQSLADQVTQIQKQGAKAGKSPDQIAEFLGRETTRATMNARAMADAMESKMQGKNRWNEAITSTISKLDRSDNSAANIAGYVLKSIFPILRVGPNVFKQGTSLFGGGVKAGIEWAGKGDMTPERADYILKNLGQQGVGLALIGVGMALSGSLGGVPRPGDKKREEAGAMKAGEADVAGLPVGHYAFHGAPASMLQIGAGLVHVYEEERGLNHEDAVDAALNSIGSNVWNWTERTLPYTDQLRRTSNTAQYGRGAGEVVGNQIRGMVIPLALQQAAAAGDEFKGFRKPRSIAEDVKLGVPGLRETVPIEREKRKH